MRTATKMSAYGLVLAAVFGGAWAAGPLAAAPPMRAMAPEGGMPGMAEHESAPGAVLPGLASAAGGYRLEVATTRLTAHKTEPFTFRIVHGHGGAVTDFAVEHDKRLHLILVRRDGAGYQHLHPAMAADGTWRVPVTVSAAGTYRVFTDFRPTGGAKTTLGSDLQVPGDFQPLDTRGPVTSTTVDGYRVTLHGDLRAGEESTLVAEITRGGEPVSDLQTYLGAYGHLVVLRATDLGYLHVHPLAQDPPGTAGPRVRFAAELPTPGTYRLYLDFRHRGEVHTAQFTVDTVDTEEAPR